MFYGVFLKINQNHIWTQIHNWFINGILNLGISNILENSQNVSCFDPLLNQNFYHVQKVVFVRKTFHAFTVRRKGQYIRCSSLWTVMDSEWILLWQIQCSSLKKYSFLRWERLVHTVVSLCKYITCLALIYEIGMCLNSMFMGWGMSVVNRTPQIHVLAIRFLAETFILSHDSSKFIIWNHIWVFIIIVCSHKILFFPGVF